MDKRVCVAFPAYNEEKNIEKVVDEAINTLKNSGFRWTILVVDDGSSDATAQIIEDLSEREINMRVVRHEVNRGYAAATRTALENAEGDIIFVIDSDGQQTAKDIPKFVEKIQEGYDIVVGWKKVRKDPAHRILMSKVYNSLFNLLFDMNLHDVDCGFRAFTKDAASKIKIEYEGIPVGPEIFAKARYMDMKVAELPVEHFPRQSGDSLFIPWKLPLIVLRVFASLIKLRLKSLK